MKNQFIKDLKPGDSVDDIFRVVEMEIKKSTYDHFLRVVVMDRTGQISGVRFKVNPDDEAAEAGDFVRIVGVIDEYNGGVQIQKPVSWYWPTEEALAAIDYADFETVAPMPYDCLVKRFKALVDEITVTNPGLARVVTMATRPVWNDFGKFPAAIQIHHATKHGLLQHSVEVATIAKAMAWVDKSFGRTSTIDVDLVVAGALLHDIGKVFEFARNPQGAFEFSDAGGLYGHVYLGMRHVEIACVSAYVDGPTTMRLLHIIAAHHGKYEHGAIVEPRTDEAKIVAAADRRSAELDIDEAARQKQGLFPKTINGRVYNPRAVDSPAIDRADIAQEFDPQAAFEASQAGKEYEEMASAK